MRYCASYQAKPKHCLPKSQRRQSHSPLACRQKSNLWHVGVDGPQLVGMRYERLAETQERLGDRLQGFAALQQ